MCKFASGALIILIAAFATQAVRAESEAGSRLFVGGERIGLHFEPASIEAVKDQVVREDGTITLPTGSTVQIKGKTLSESKKIIAEQ
jgi:hypothetical protein